VTEGIDVEGSVSFPGGTLPGALVYLQPITSSAVPPFPIVTQTGAAGQFRAHLPKQMLALDVVLFPPGFATEILRVMPNGQQPPTLDFQVSSATGTLEIQLAPQQPGGEPTLIRNGIAIPVVVLLRHGMGSGTVQVQKDRVVFQSMAPGDYTYCFSGGGPGTGCVQGLLGTGETLSLTSDRRAVNP